MIVAITLCLLTSLAHATEGALGRPVAGTSVLSGIGIVPPEQITIVSLQELYIDGSVNGSREENGSARPSVDSIKAHLRVYPYSQRAAPPATRFTNTSGMVLNTVHSNDITFFDEVNQIIQEDPAGAYGPDMTGIFRAIGLEKGKPFAPDDRMKKILVDAVAVGNATARAIDFANRDPSARMYPDRHWITLFRLYGPLEPWFAKSWKLNDIAGS